MAAILPFVRRAARSDHGAEPRVADLLAGASLEVMPKTAAAIEDFRAILPEGTRVYVAQIDGTPFDDMLATARRLRAEGMVPMPHLPARGIESRAALEAMVAAYAEVGVTEALVLAGGIAAPRGPFASSMDLLETHVLDRAGFTRIHVAGHPEGNPDIPAPDAAAALAWKNAFQSRTDAAMGITTQFAFEAEPLFAWARTLRDGGITLPIHLGVAGPAKLQTLIRYAMLCGVGPSLRVLQRRAADLTRLVLPFEPTELLSEIARRKAEEPDSLIAGVHIFPLGGIGRTTDYLGAQRQAPARARRA
jgi:methylenetetrahydrofolate reductase (NADPH)